MLYVDIKKRLEGFDLEVKLEINAGRVGLLGGSGSGKSMTLKSIAGIESPDEGTIILNNRVLFDSKKKINLPVRERNVGYLFQNYALFPNMTALQNIASGMKDMNKKEKVEAATKMLDRLHLQGLENRYPKELSGGQQQRVAIGRMLAAKPDILMFDEPFSALDAYLRGQMQEELLEILEGQDRISLIVSHDIDEAYRLCNQIAVVNNGRIEIMDTKENVFNNPRKENVARLIGCKNISRAKKLSDTKVLAVDWGVELEIKATAEPIHYIGIHANHIGFTEYNEANTFSFKLKSINENRFADTVVFCLEKQAHNGLNEVLRLDIDKGRWKKDIEENQRILLPKDKLLLLK